ncbi:GrpB family protein [Bogoriella caseilytica]|uniref:GrpB-like predicted nucleotidyltransferase (UPF0157 family) n=1 Tax=Bogoriella caseilytica TaxID=56055 RepID=A0A3N2BAK2_9MICO|nr:GrpB family protein [Bogoriella caseilytica]ROR72192.1 GrpB-like predicted nucleotidyltransferase (UPF0157 family) [Bogoriella caseilytica]
MSAEPPIDEPVSVVRHDECWELQATRLIDEVSRITRARTVQHIGSTAVPGLSAKPIIDLMADVGGADRDAAAQRLTEAGFTDFGEISEGRRYLIRRSAPATNVHFIDASSSLWSDNLVFRDYLRAHPEAASAYDEAKHNASRTGRLLAYSDAKEPLVREIMNTARAWRVELKEAGFNPDQARP